MILLRKIDSKNISYKYSQTELPLTFKYLYGERQYIKIPELQCMEIVDFENEDQSNLNYENGTVVGIVSFYPNRILPNSINISTFEIIKKLHGQGFGTAAILSIIDYFNKSSFRVLTLQTKAPELEKFYSRFGFKKIKWGDGFTYMRRYYDVPLREAKYGRIRIDWFYKACDEYEKNFDKIQIKDKKKRYYKQLWVFHKCIEKYAPSFVIVQEKTKKDPNACYGHRLDNGEEIIALHMNPIFLNSCGTTKWDNNKSNLGATIRHEMTHLHQYNRGEKEVRNNGFEVDERDLYNTYFKDPKELEAWAVSLVQYLLKFYDPNDIRKMIKENYNMLNIPIRNHIRLAKNYEYLKKVRTNEPELFQRFFIDHMTDYLDDNYPEDAKIIRDYDFKRGRWRGRTK